MYLSLTMAELEFPSHNPWQTLHSEEVYESPWIKLTKHDVINPGGGNGTYSVVHFKNLALGVIALDEDHNTWLVGQYRYPLNQYTWEIPEGGGDRNIDPLISIQRELKEETGITATTWTHILDMHLSNSATDEFCKLYVAQDLQFGAAHPEEDEDLRVIKIPFDELYQLVNKGILTDSLTVAAVLKVKLLLLEGKL